MTRVIAHAETKPVTMSHAIACRWQMLGASLHALHFRLGAAARAHERRRTFEAFGEDTMRDLGMAPEIATGLPSWEADLPFFMQAGFGRR